MWRGIKGSWGRSVRRGRAALLVVGVSLCAAAPAAASVMPTTVKEFPVDVGHSVSLESLIVGPDGNLWYQEHYWPEGQYHALIGRMDEAGNFAEFDKGLHKYSSLSELVAGPDGNVWFADRGSYIFGGAIGRVEPDGTITRYTAGLRGSEPRRITVGPDGNLWFTAAQGSPGIGFATPEGEITTFSLPGGVWDAVAGPDGNVWFTYGGDGASPAIGRVARQDGGGAIITLFHTGFKSDSWPSEIIAGQDGYLWFSGWNDTRPFIGRVSMNGKVDLFSDGLNPEGGIGDMAVGPSGDIWFTNGEANDVGRVSPQGEITELGNGELSTPQQIVPGPDGNMWFTYGNGIGKISPTGKITKLREGLAPSVTPEEIVSGPNGYLWFTASDGFEAAIGRITPGNDDPVEPVVERPHHSPPRPAPSYGRLSLQGTDLRVTRSGRAVIRLTCENAGTCSGGLQLFAPQRRKRVGRPLTLGRPIGYSSFSIGAWGSAGIRVQVNRWGRRLLAEEGVTKVRLQVSSLPYVLPLHERLTLRPAPRKRPG